MKIWVAGWDMGLPPGRRVMLNGAMGAKMRSDGAPGCIAGALVTVSIFVAVDVAESEVEVDSCGFMIENIFS
jgi:hypothetical protein